MLQNMVTITAIQLLVLPKPRFLRKQNSGTQAAAQGGMNIKLNIKISSQGVIKSALMAKN